ncbi:PQQ-binding-like beta-propeller repeat protein [Microbacterium sp. BWT-B31]|uniref:outer membrane protein assembly factor BamB family protein n=1 Tax=Microbacterium sp. BWT-B31 TaxID=3232072 RepID=UPI003527D335
MRSRAQMLALALVLSGAAAASGCTPAVSVTRTEALWQVRLDHTVQVEAATASTIWLESAAGGELTALDANDGEVRWSRPLAPTISGSFPVDGALVIRQYVNDQSIVTAIDEQSGETVWQQSVAGGLTGVLDDQRLVEVLEPGRVAVVDRGGVIVGTPWAAPPGCDIGDTAVRTESAVIAVLVSCDDAGESLVLLDESLQEQASVALDDSFPAVSVDISGPFFIVTDVEYVLHVIDDQGAVAFSGLADPVTTVMSRTGTILRTYDSRLIDVRADATIAAVDRPYFDVASVSGGVRRVALNHADGTDAASWLMPGGFSIAAALSPTDYLTMDASTGMPVLSRVRLVRGSQDPPVAESLTILPEVALTVGALGPVSITVVDDSDPEQAAVVVTASPFGAHLADASVSRLLDSSSAAAWLEFWLRTADVEPVRSTIDGSEVAATDESTFVVRGSCVVRMVQTQAVAIDPADRAELALAVLDSTVVKGCGDG